MATETTPFEGLYNPVQDQIRNSGSAFWRHCGFVGLEAEEFRKRCIVVWLLVSSAIGGTLHTGLYIWFGYPKLAIFTVLYLITAALNLSLLLLTKNYRVFRAVQLSCYLIFPLGTHIIIGGYVDSSGLILAGWLAPLCGMIFAPKETARWLFWGFLFVIVAGLAIEYYQDLPELKLPRTTRVTMFIFNMCSVALQGFFLMESFLVKKDAIQAALAEEKRRTEQLLLNILPEETASELKATGHAKARNYPSATIIFTDFVGFSNIAAELSPEEVVEELDFYFQAFDEITDRHGLEKIKTIGDAYMAVGGVPVKNKTHAADAVRAGLEICEFVKKAEFLSKQRCGFPFAVRVGIHTGPLVAGVVGVKKFAFDVWGDSVNLASRMESKSEANRVNISQNTFELVKNEFACEHRGKISAKSRGEVEMYFVENLPLNS